MTKHKNTSNSLAGRARALAEKTGMPYTAALEALRTPQAESPHQEQEQRQGGFVLTPDVERFVDGDDQIGVEYDLREFLRERAAKKYECYECYEPGNVATDRTSVIFTVSVFDPDLNPGTHIMSANLAHASCTPSVIRWAVPVEIPQQPHRVSVEVPDDPEERIFRFEFEAAAHLAPADEPDGPPVPVLLITAESEEYEPHPALFHLLDFHLLEDGFAAEDPRDMGEHGWSLRLEHDASASSSSWIAVRAHTAGTDEEMGHGHFFLAAVDLTGEWVTAARDRARVLLLVGPVGPHTSLPDLDDEGPDDVLELLENGLVRGGWCPIDAPEAGHVRPANRQAATTSSP